MGTLTGPLLDLAEGVCADNDPYFFSRFSNVYNSHLSMSAVGVDNGRNEGWDTIFGDHAVRITGRTYHFFHTTGRSCGLQFYIHNATALVDEKNERTECLQSHIVGNLLAQLREENRLVEQFEFIGEVERKGNHEITELSPQFNIATQDFDVSFITSDNVLGNRILKVQRTGSKNSTNIDTFDSLFEPLSYPLLFPNGQDGWGEKVRAAVPFHNYLPWRMLCPDEVPYETGYLTRIINRVLFKVPVRYLGRNVQITKPFTEDETLMSKMMQLMPDEESNITRIEVEMFLGACERVSKTLPFDYIDEAHLWTTLLLLG